MGYREVSKFFLYGCYSERESCAVIRKTLCQRSSCLQLNWLEMITSNKLVQGISSSHPTNGSTMGQWHIHRKEEVAVFEMSHAYALVL